MSDSLSIFTTNENQETKQYSTYTMEIVLEINDTEELSEGVLPINS